MVAFLLIGVGTYAKTSSIVVTLPIVGGIVACGVFLLFVAILGLIATVKHHQVMLFFYMMILFVIFVIQFSVACACIGVNLEQEKKMSKTVSLDKRFKISESIIWLTNLWQIVHFIFFYIFILFLYFCIGLGICQEKRNKPDSPNGKVLPVLRI